MKRVETGEDGRRQRERETDRQTADREWRRENREKETFKEESMIKRESK